MCFLSRFAEVEELNFPTKIQVKFGTNEKSIRSFVQYQVFCDFITERFAHYYLFYLIFVGCRVLSVLKKFSAIKYLISKSACGKLAPWNQWKTCSSSFAFYVLTASYLLFINRKQYHSIIIIFYIKFIFW